MPSARTTRIEPEETEFKCMTRRALLVSQALRRKGVFQSECAVPWTKPLSVLAEYPAAAVFGMASWPEGLLPHALLKTRDALNGWPPGTTSATVTGGAPAVLKFTLVHELRPQPVRFKIVPRAV